MSHSTLFKECVSYNIKHRISVVYVWIDAFGKLREKTKIFNNDELNILDSSKAGFVRLFYKLPDWNFDGSSTGQATGDKSDVLLKPRYMYFDPFRNFEKCRSYIVLCDTYNQDGTPHVTNKRFACAEREHEVQEKHKLLFGVEQEYIVYQQGLPYYWETIQNPVKGITGIQGQYYCSIGCDNNFIREIMEAHLEMCMLAGLSIRGTNAEVTPSQGEYQLGELSGLELADQHWLSKYILERVCENRHCTPVYDPKPLTKWNGNSCHTNISSKNTMNGNNEHTAMEHITIACDKLKARHAEHMAVYGNPETNKERMTGDYETSDMNNFSCGETSRKVSVRIPHNVVHAEKGYFEDRRLPGDADLYVTNEIIMETICSDTL